jgi:lipoyl-dependent peroxiredoxin
MAVRTATAQWDGGLRDGNGRMRLGGGAYEGPYSFQSRFEEGQGTNPEELIGAAHAGCFSMALAAELGRAGHEPTRIATTARVHLLKRDDGFAIARIELDTEGEVPGIDEATFQEKAEAAKAGCPVSRALQGGPEITVSARLV